MALPAAANPTLPSSTSDNDAVKQLQATAKALHAENTTLARGVDLLRQQLGHRDALETWIKYEHTKYYMRNLSLFMRKYGAVTTVQSAVQDVPEKLKAGFAMNGKSRIEAGFLHAAYPDHYKDSYTDFDIEAYKRLWRLEPAGSDDDGQCKISFGLSQGPTDLALQRAAKSRLHAGDQVAVIGSRGPVYEALCLECGARPTTIRRMPVDNRAADVKTLDFAEWEKATQPFDAAVAVCVVEQAGLGMHGEPLDPDGDLAIMRQLKRSLKPGGLCSWSCPPARTAPYSIRPGPMGRCDCRYCSTVGPKSIATAIRIPCFTGKATIDPCSFLKTAPLDRAGRIGKRYHWKIKP